MNESNPSPRWTTPIKMLVAITSLAALAGLLIKFQGILPPLIIVVTLAYLFNPVADILSRRLHLPWRGAVTLLYAVVVFLLMSLLTLGGVGLVQQVQSLLSVIQQSLSNIPTIFNNISGREFYVGPFLLDLRTVDLTKLGEQLLSSINPLIGRTGDMLGLIAGGAFNLFGWTVFVLLVSYFILIESDGLWQGIVQFHIPGYEHDMRHMGIQLGHIWNAFLRGQLIVMALAAAIYAVMLSVMGVNYSLGLALLAGLARFIPYVGPFCVWTILALVTYFQEYKLLGLEAWVYALIVVGFAWLIDGIVDNIVMPRIMASALKVHPAAVLVAALVALDLLGILGVILAAPMLATLQLFGRYITRKMFDLDPWAGLEAPPSQPSIRTLIITWIGSLRAKLKLR